MKKFTISRGDFLRGGAALGALGLLPWRGDLVGQEGATIPLSGVTGASGREEIVTTCNMCYLGCSVFATRDPGGEILHLRGNPASPVNRGRLCAKGQAGIYKAVHPERLLRPLIRAGSRGSGQWKAVSWERALGVVASSLLEIKKDFGPESIALWQNLNMDRPDIFRRFIFALGSPNFIGHVSTCNSSQLVGGALTYGVARQHFDFENAECIVAMGSNLLGAKELVLSARGILEAREQGARLIAVDPRLSETAALADLWLPLRPGTDGILLAGWANRLIEKEKYDLEFVKRFTFGFEKIRRYLRRFDPATVCERTGLTSRQFMQGFNMMAGRRTLIASGRGVITHSDATDAVRMAEILNALLGSFDVTGGVLLSEYPPFKIGTVEPEVKPPLFADRFDRSGAGSIPLPVGPRGENPAAFFGLSHEVPRNILNEDPYPLRALIFNAVNPVYSLPEGGDLVKAFKKLKLIVSMDAFMSETTRYADVVLPAATYLEGLDLWGPQGVKVGLRQPVIRPRGESRPNQEIVIALARKLGLKKQFPFRTYEDFIRAQLAGSGIDYGELREKGFIPYSESELRPGRWRASGFGTPSGKIELVSSVLGFAGYSPEPIFARWRDAEADREYPLYLITYKLPFHTQSATMENPYLAAIQTDNPVLINPRTAAKIKVRSGERIRIESERGALEARVKYSEGVRPDTLALAHHFGHKAYSKWAAGRGVNANPVIHAGTDPVGGNATYNDTRVRIRKI